MKFEEEIIFDKNWKKTYSKRTYVCTKKLYAHVYIFIFLQSYTTDNDD